MSILTFLTSLQMSNKRNEHKNYMKKSFFSLFSFFFIHLKKIGNAFLIVCGHPRLMILLYEKIIKLDLNARKD